MTILNPSFWNALVTLPLTNGAICVIAISPFCAADAVPAVVAFAAVVVAVPTPAAVTAALPVGATVFITVVFTVVTRVSILEPFLYEFVPFVAVNVSVVVTFFLDDFTFFFFFVTVFPAFL